MSESSEKGVGSDDSLCNASPPTDGPIRLKLTMCHQDLRENAYLYNQTDWSRPKKTFVRKIGSKVIVALYPDRGSY